MVSRPRRRVAPGYHPAALLKIYLYDYLNQVQSSRRLERECGRNLELIWLTGRLAPDFKTIADFRRDNGPAIRKVCSRFVALCRDLHLLDGNAVAIDGSKFKAVNHREKNFTKGRLAKRIAAIESTIDRYLKELNRADREQEVIGVPVPAAKVARLARGIETLKAKLGRLSAIEARMLASGETQISLTDPDPPGIDGREGTRGARCRDDRGFRRQGLLQERRHRSLRGRRDRGLRSAAADVKRAGGGPIRSPRLRLRRQERHLCLPGVADFCAGLGGTVRYLAYKYGANVTGIEFTPVRVAGAQDLTRRVGLQDVARIVEGNVMDVPLADASFDAVVSQESFCHVPDVKKAVMEASRILRTGGRLAFTDWVANQPLSAADAQLMWDGMAIQPLRSIPDYRCLVEGTGLKVLSVTDLTDEWGPILKDRLAMYQRSREEARQAGTPLGHDAFHESYIRVVELVQQHKLGGIRIIATK